MIALMASGGPQTTTVPVSVIFGRNDPNFNPDVAHHLSSLFKNSQLRLVDQASHWPQWDRPEVVADLIKGSIAATAI